MCTLEKLPFALKNVTIMLIALKMKSALMNNVNQVAQMMVIVNLGPDVSKTHACLIVDPAKIASLLIIVILITRFVT